MPVTEGPTDVLEDMYAVHLYIIYEYEWLIYCAYTSLGGIHTKQHQCFETSAGSISTVHTVCSTQAELDTQCVISWTVSW